MKAKCKRDDLLAAIRLAGRIAGFDTGVPVCIEVADAGLAISAKSETEYVICPVDTVGDLSHGRIYVWEDVVTALIELAESDITLDTGPRENCLRISHASGFADFPGTTEGRFTWDTDAEMKGTIRLKAEEAFALLSKVQKAKGRVSAGRDEFLNILVSVKGDSVAFVSTDSHRLHVAKAKLESKAVQDFNAIVPGAYVSVVRHLGTPEGEVLIGIAENKVKRQVFRCHGDRGSFVGASGSGFPAYEKLVKHYHDAAVQWSAIFNREALQEAFQRAHVVSESYMGYRGNVSWETSLLGNGIRIEAGAEGVGSSTIDCECEEINGSPIPFGVSTKYMLDGVAAFESKRLAIRQCGNMLIIEPHENTEQLLVMIGQMAAVEKEEKTKAASAAS